MIKNYIIIQVYIDKNKDMILVPYKESKAGYALAVEPYKKLNSRDWENVSKKVFELLNLIVNHPKTEETESSVIKQICGNKGFKHFSKNHICIEIKFIIDEKKFVISNQPRLFDGSYGVEKNTISEKYGFEHISSDDLFSVQQNFLKAYIDAGRYLQEIGCKL